MFMTVDPGKIVAIGHTPHGLHVSRQSARKESAKAKGGALAA
jgi:hypothetical protein